MRGALLAAATALGSQRLLLLTAPGGRGRWERRNHRGAPVSLAEGPALALALAASGGPAAAAAVLGAAVCGAVDDVAGSADKGFRGHLAALRRGRVTTGAAKVVGIGASGLLGAALLGRRPALDVLLDGAVVAGAANAVNLFDLRPGRALKVGFALAALTGQAAPAAAALVLLPGDLGERTMLGDAGANALGAALGTGVVVGSPARRTRLGWLVGLVGVAALSEAVSFSRIIDAVPPLRAVDRLGRVA